MSATWANIWFCIWADHNGHTGCSDLMWLSNAYDIGLASLCFASYGTILGWIGLDWWKGRL